MEQPFEEKYQDVLQNIEMGIVTVYRDHRELTDYQVDSALEALGRTYLRNTPILPKNELAKAVYQAMKSMCDWRLGGEAVVDEEDQPMNMDPLSVDEILACLKRLRKSVSMWNKQGGTRGYLDYISNFMR
jgi:hypothetical protein